jgi:hypothetical protein
MSKYTAIIIEPRKHKALSFVLNNFLTNLSDDWSIIIFHGNANVDYVKNIVENLEQKHKNRILNLINLNVDNLTHHVYSQIFMTEGFYNFIPTETFLVFQTDSMIFKENKDLIKLFLQYDYVGAPWVSDNKVGNGGLSLRKKSKMIEIIKSKGYVHLNEDIYFSSDVDNKIQYNVPDYTIAKLFSVETLFYDRPFGIHNCWRYLNKENMDFLINKYSDLQELMNLQ